MVGSNFMRLLQTFCYPPAEMVVTNAIAPWADAPRFDYRLFKDRVKMARSYRSLAVNLRKFLISKSDEEKGGTTYVRHKDIPGTGGFVHEIPQLPRAHEYFIVVLYPPPDLEDEELDGSDRGVDLLFDVSSLYYLGFSYDKFWRLFQDATLVGVSKESEAAMKIKRLRIKGSYQGIGMDYEELIIGFAGQLETYKVLANLGWANQTRLKRVSCRNVVTISESMRFPFLLKLHLTVFEMGFEDAAMDLPVKVGEEYRNPSAHLNDWSNYSGKCSEGEEKFAAELKILPIPGIPSFECLLNFVSFLSNKDHEKANKSEHSEKNEQAIANRDGDKKGDGNKDPQNDKDGKEQQKKNNSSSTWFFESPVMPYRWIPRSACLTKMVLHNNYAAVKFAQEFGIKVCSDLALVTARVLPLPRLRYHDSGREKTFGPSVGQWKMISKMVLHNNYAAVKFAQEGIKVCSDLALVPARVLPLPMLRYHDSGREKTFAQSVGQWKMISKKMINGGIIDNWASVSFSCMRPEEVYRFCCDLIQICNATGMSVCPRPVVDIRSATPNNIMNILRDVHRRTAEILNKHGKDQVQLLVMILPEDTGSYGKIKRVCETDLGIGSQCCLPRHASRPNKQYLENVALKVNVKAAGRNTVLDIAFVRNGIPFVSEVRTIIFGSDVTHPPPGEDSASSTAAVMASMDWPEITKYRGLVSAQPHRQKIIEDLFSVIKVPQKGAVNAFPPAYYAHLAAFRARYYVEGDNSDGCSKENPTRANGFRSNYRNPNSDVTNRELAGRMAEVYASVSGEPPLKEPFG